MLDLKKLSQSHERFLRVQKMALEDELQEAGKTGVAYAKARPKFTPRTGTLQAGNEYKVLRIGGRVRTVRLLNKVKYASPIDKGSRPHIIRSKPGGPPLAFMGRDGKMAFRRSVRHPGNKPYKFLYSATLVAGRSFNQSMDRRMSRITRGF